MPRKKPPAVEYETLARWRNGWHLIRLPDGRHYLKRAYRGQYPVEVQKVGFCQWRITNPATGEVVSPAYMK